jgi:hypothetical protein
MTPAVVTTRPPVDLTVGSIPQRSTGQMLGALLRQPQYRIVTVLHRCISDREHAKVGVSHHYRSAWQSLDTDLE